MENLTETKVCQLAMSPFYVLYLVTSEYLPPGRVTERHIVRAMEYGLEAHTPFSEAIFDLLRSNLHEFYAELSGERNPDFLEKVRAELVLVNQLLAELSGPPEMVEDFRTALKNFAAFVAGGGAFRKEIDDPGMQSQVTWISNLLES